MECLITNKICPSNNRKCKVCNLDDCRKVLEMIQRQEQMEDERKKKLIQMQLPEQCKNCSFLEYIDINNKKVRCSYMVTDKCLLGKYNKN